MRLDLRFPSSWILSILNEGFQWVANDPAIENSSRLPADRERSQWVESVQRNDAGNGSVSNGMAELYIIF